MFRHNNVFCSFRKSNNNGFFEAIKQLKLNFKVVDNVISEKHVKSFIKKDYKPKKFKAPLTNIIVFDLETFNKIRAVPYGSGIHKLSKISGKYIRYISEIISKLSKGL